MKPMIFSGRLQACPEFHFEWSTIMKKRIQYSIPLLMAFLLLVFAVPSWAVVDVQCPGDENGDGLWTKYCEQTLEICDNNGDCHGPGGQNPCI